MNVINIEEIRKAREEKINKRINEIDDPNLNYQQKRLKVLNEINSSNYNPDFIFFPDNKIKIIDIEEIRNFKDEQIKQKIINLKDENLSYEQKLLKILDEYNSSINSFTKDKDISNINQYKIIGRKKIGPEIKIKELDSNDSNDQSTRDNSQIISDLNFSIDINNISKSKKDYWIQFNLYDAIVPNLSLKNLIICDLDKEKEIFCYLYNNKLKTYYFIKNIHFGKDYPVNDKIIEDKDYNKSYGLFFCGKKIEIEKNEIQECIPDKMICINCMEKNRKIYNLESIYLININGRVAIENDGKYHCFGHFLVGNQIENCIQKFSCEACKLLDKYDKYYFPIK